MDSLKQFIQSNPGLQELKRAFAVQMSRRGYSYREIRLAANAPQQYLVADLWLQAKQFIRRIYLLV